MKVQALADIDQAPLLQRAQGVGAEVHEITARIVADVIAGGDGALRELTHQFDGADLADPWLPANEWDTLAQQCPADVRNAIVNNLARIEAFHAEQATPDIEIEPTPGIRLGRRAIVDQRTACYVPGGRASYPSTVLMTVTPARLAGVPDIIVVTPPGEDGAIDPAVAYAAKAAGANRILRAGGAQAIAALALGTKLVPRVDSIVGPGNAYVTAAKQQLASQVRIDSPAGPSELLVIADASADPKHIALDMMAQAEHDPDAQVVLVSTDDALAHAVAKELEARVPEAARSDIIAKSLEQGAILTAPMHEAIAFANAYAAEHLEIITEQPHEVLRHIRHAGSIFLGPWAPVSLGDYGSGTNHVLPTMGYARLTGGLSLDAFRKWVTWQDVTENGLRAVASDITTLADAEGLHAHADAVRQRLEAN